MLNSNKNISKSLRPMQDQNLFKNQDPSLDSHWRSILQPSRTFDLKSQLISIQNIINKIVSDYIRFEDQYYSIYLLGRPPQINSGNAEFLSLKNLKLEKIHQKDFQRLKTNYDQIYKIYNQTSKLFSLLQYDQIQENQEKMMTLINSNRKILKINDYQEQQLRLAHQKEPDDSIEQQRGELEEFKPLHQKNQDLDDRDQESFFDQQQQLLDKHEHVKISSQKVQILSQTRQDIHAQFIEKEKEPNEILEQKSSARPSYQKEFIFKSEKEQISSNTILQKRYNPEYQISIPIWSEFYINLKANIKMLTGKQLQLPVDQPEFSGEKSQAEFKYQASILHEEAYSNEKEKIVFDFKNLSYTQTKESEFVPMNLYEELNISIISVKEESQGSFSNQEHDEYFLLYDLEKDKNKMNLSATDTNHF